MEPLSDTKQLGRIIRETRKNQKLTQKQLAATCGVGIRFISELEKGKESCHIGKALEVVNMLGLDVLIEGRDKT